jgi:hypothetical protein
MRFTGWPLLAVAAVLMLTAGVRLVSNDRDVVGGVAIVAGLVILGAWLAVEIQSWRDDDEDEVDDA